MREPTITIDDLAKKILGSRLSQSIDQICFEYTTGIMPELSPSINETAPSLITVDDLAKRYLPTKVNQALDRAEENLGEVGLGIQIKEIHIYARGKGVTLLKILIIIAALLFGTDHVIHILQALL